MDSDPGLSDSSAARGSPRTGGEADVGSNAVLATECFGRLGKSPRLRIHIYTRKPILSAPQDCCLDGPKFSLPLREPHHTVDALEPAGEGQGVGTARSSLCKSAFVSFHLANSPRAPVGEQ